jgi:transcriptional regulator with XRE-family HTH domain
MTKVLEITPERGDATMLQMKRIRLLNGWSQTDVGARIRSDRGEVSKIERGLVPIHAVPDRKIVMLEEVFQMPIRELLREAS